MVETFVLFQVGDILQNDPDLRPEIDDLLNERLPKVCYL